MSKSRRFGCKYCGTPFEVYPPDDAHPRATLEKPKEEDVTGTIIEMTYDCKYKQCGRPTTLYWYRRRMTIGVG